MVEDSARSRDCNRMLLGIWFAWMHRASFPFVANDTGASIASLCTVPVVATGNSPHYGHINNSCVDPKTKFKFKP